MADDGDHSPVWARGKRRRGNSVIGLRVTLLALFGILTAGLGVKEKSLAESGAMMDGWISSAVSKVRGEAPKDAHQAGVAAASDELKKQ